MLPLEPKIICLTNVREVPKELPKLGLDDTVELLTKILGASDEDPDLNTFSVPLKTNLGLPDLKKSPSTMSRGMELLTTDVKSYP